MIERKKYIVRALTKVPLRVVFAEVIDVLGVLDWVAFTVLEVERARSV